MAFQRGSIGPRRFYRLLSQFGDARAVWDRVGDQGMDFLGPKALKSLREARTEEFFFRLFAGMERAGMRAVTRIGEGYPESLSAIHDPPPTLYVRGEASLSAGRMFAVVGSRQATRDGKRAAREFSATLAREGVCVVSGLARGVDTCAHEGALEGGGATIAVLGSGADVIYPPENEALAERILENGGAIVSECAPRRAACAGELSRPQPHYQRPVRRGCAGGRLADLRRNDHRGVRRRAGPRCIRRAGSIYAPLSAAPNRLIFDGAYPALSAWDILEHYRWAARPAARAEKARAFALDEEERLLFEALAKQELSFDELSALSKFPASKLNSLLTSLELRA